MISGFKSCSCSIYYIPYVTKIATPSNFLSVWRVQNQRITNNMKMDHADGQLSVIAPLGCNGFKNKRSNRNRMNRISPSTNVINESPKGLQCSHSSFLMGRYEGSEFKSLTSVIYQSTDLTLFTQSHGLLAPPWINQMERKQLFPEYLLGAHRTHRYLVLALIRERHYPKRSL